MYYIFEHLMANVISQQFLAMNTKYILYLIWWKNLNCDPNILKFSSIYFGVLKESLKYYNNNEFVIWNLFVTHIRLNTDPIPLLLL